MFKPLPYILIGKRRREISREFRVMNADLARARKMQLALLRHNDIKLPDSLDVGVMLKQSRYVGGDLYMYSVQNNLFRFIIADVCGKGMTAALYMSAIHHILITIDKNESPAEFCNILNNELCKLNIDGMYMTMITGTVNLRTGEVAYVNAGHTSPIYWGADTSAKYFNGETDIPIGIIEDFTYTNNFQKLNAHDTVILYTDGITDSINEAEENFGKDRLLETLHRCKSRKPADIIAKVSKDIRTYNNHVPQSDDMILMALCYNGEELFHQATVIPQETIDEISLNNNEIINEIQITI